MRNIPTEGIYKKCSYKIPLIGIMPEVGRIVIKNQSRQNKNTGCFLKSFKENKIKIATVRMLPIIEKLSSEVTACPGLSYISVFGKKRIPAYIGSVEKKVRMRMKIF